MKSTSAALAICQALWPGPEFWEVGASLAWSKPFGKSGSPFSFFAVLSTALGSPLVRYASRMLTRWSSETFATAVAGSGAASGGGTGSGGIASNGASAGGGGGGAGCRRSAGGGGGGGGLAEAPPGGAGRGGARAPTAEER